MSEWNDMILTQKGLNLQAKVEAGKCELELLRVELGSGTPEEAENIQELTALKNHEINVGISDKTPKDGGICTITGIITNQDVNIGFYAKEMGVIAKDPDAGEILYMYATDNNPDFVPAKTSKYVVNASYSIDVAISNAEMINAKIDSAGLVTVSILNHYIENHNEDNTTHANLFKTLFNITEVNATKIKDKIKSYGKEVVQELFGITSATTDNLKTKIKEWAQEQINSWLETLGIRYNIAQNGYICLGKLFGDAIIQWGLVNILQNQQTIIKELNISWSYCIACACVLEEAGQFSLIKWLDKQSNGHSIKFMSQNKVTDENGVWFSFIGIGKY
nr:MAG TPA: tail collar fiber protein [Caudoviricetes sp.]